MLDAPAHLHHVLHDFLDWRILDRHVHGADSDHQVKAGNNIASILNKFVQVCQVIDGMGLLQVNGQVPQCVEDGHVKLVILLRTETGGS